jgi:hypothetical protein
MRYLSKYKFFESKDDIIEARIKEEDQLMGKLLHLYGSIPLPKEKSSVVIKKIIEGSGIKPFIFGKDNINISRTAKYRHDKVRFKDYFDSLIRDKDSRGHNFEGTLCGLFGGELSTRGEKWDLILNGLTWSVKFIDNPSKAPEIGSFRNAISNYGIDLFDQVANSGGLTQLFKTGEADIKEKLFNIVTNGITGGWIVAHAIGRSIVMNIIDLDTMRRILLNEGMTVSPKGGKKSIYSLAISARFKNVDGVKVSKITFPQLTLEELRKIYKSDTENEWAYNVFGSISNKMRPDVLRDIKMRPEEIADNLIRFKDFKSRKLS